MVVDLVVRITRGAAANLEELRRHGGQVDLESSDVVRTLCLVSLEAEIS
jgi:hypothetical protein